MFLKVFGLGASALLGTLYMTGNLGTISGTAYDRPPAEVYAALEYMPMPADLKEDIGRGNATVEVDRTPGEQVRWRVSRKGYEVFRLTADISPLAGGKATSVRTKLTAAESDPQKGIGILPGMAGVMVEEQIASTIERRPYDKRKAQQRAAGYMVANQQQMVTDVSKSMDAAATRMDKRSDPDGNSGARFVPGQPMVDVSRDSSSD